MASCTAGRSGLFTTAAAIADIQGVDDQYLTIQTIAPRIKAAVDRSDGQRRVQPRDTMRAKILKLPRWNWYYGGGHILSAASATVSTVGHRPSSRPLPPATSSRASLSRSTPDRRGTHPPHSCSRSIRDSQSCRWHCNGSLLRASR
jgi:hypothetical protein